MASPISGYNHIEVQDLRLKHLVSAEREELVDHIAGMAHGDVDEFDVTSRFVTRFQAAEDELSTSLNDRQEIVEVMGHAARQPPDGL